MDSRVLDICYSASRRRYFRNTGFVFFGVFLLQIILFYKQHVVNDLETNVHWYNMSKFVSRSEMPIDFSVNDILDHMTHVERHGDFVNNNFTDILPNFVKTYTQQKSKQDLLTVIVVPHSHNDPGYKKTFSEYFNQSTRNILSLLIEKLYQYNDAKFVWPESCFLERWWAGQNKQNKIKFKRLVESGRLEITSGAWVIPDEATPHYFSYLDQMIEGHVWVKQHLGVIPITSFDMDQFGYSSTARFLMGRAGIKQSSLKRVHLGMKEYLMKMKLMNFYIKMPSVENGIEHFVQLEPYEWLSFPDSCGPTRHICEDLDFGVDVTLPDPDTMEVNRTVMLLYHHYRNLRSFADKVVQQLKLKSDGYLHNVLLLPHGGDFRYSTSLEWDKQYINMKHLMKFINSDGKYNVKIRFGTLTDYFTEVEKQSEENHFKYPVVGGDFFPFTTGTGYWSGFFTTRQYLKRLGRKLQEYVRAADTLAALAFLSGHSHEIPKKVLTSILSQQVRSRRELNVFQHHDAITGTSAAYVVKDYENKLTSALITSQQVTAFFVEFFLFGNYSYLKKDYMISNDKHNENVNREDKVESPCKYVFPFVKSLTKFDHSKCMKNDCHLVVYNNFIQERYEIVNFLYHSPNISITNQKSWSNYSFDYIWHGGIAHIYFYTRLPSLSITSFVISESNNIFGKAVNINQVDFRREDFTLCENNQVNITFSLYDGSPQVMCYKTENFCESLKIGWRHFTQSGGAYTLSMSNQNENLLKSDVKIRKIVGRKRCMVEVSSQFIKVEYILKNTTGVNDRYLQVNIFTDLSRSKTRYFIGEVAMRVFTTIQNGNTFFTDSNGLQFLMRKFRKNMPYSSNVYPITSMATIHDGSRVLNIHVVQPHGVVSSEPGIVDLFIDRVSIEEDGGLSQEVTDNKLTSTKLFLHFEAFSYSNNDKGSDSFVPSIESILINDLIQHPIKSFISVKKIPVSRTHVGFLQKFIPCDIIIANMRCLTDDRFNIEGVSLTLFRRMSVTGNQMSTKGCVSSTSSALSPEALFINRASQNVSLKEMSLTHLKWRNTLLPYQKVILKEMDMKTFLFTKQRFNKEKKIK